ncbi:MAG: aminopeptidase P family protein [Candidatus Peregrinibacteria bacterium]|nr:aminopeptidase P family protein [Candidatus Peregrinibacteria bacterium]MDZ4244864.1 aminopeptidase P family protein [Candidatus Gracilibacteria bacterium]
MKLPLLVTNKFNLKYLIGFTGSNGFMLLTKDKNYFFTDGRYLEIAKKLEKSKSSKVKFEFVLYDQNFKNKWKEILKKHRIKILNFEADDLTVSKLSSFKKLSKGVIFKETVHEIATKMRVQKNRTELKKVSKAQQIIEKVFSQIKKELKVGQTEKQIAWRIKELCQKFKANDISFEPIVGFGDNSASPHHNNSDRKLKKGDVILIDHGARFQGYCSDMTRMIWTRKPTEKETEVYNTVLSAQMAGIKAIKAGETASKVAKIARKIIEEAGYGDNYTHSLGHGVGIEVHDPPTSLSTRSKDTLKEGMVVTIEPGIYLSGEFGVRIEDMGVVTKKGIKLFTKTPKQLKDCIKML